MENRGVAKTKLFANHYELQEEVGAGGRGVIYRAQGHLTGQLVGAQMYC